MEKKQLICPYCRSKDVTIWGEKTVINYDTSVKVYRCYSCGQYFEVRHIEGCGDKIFTYFLERSKVSSQEIKTA